MPSEWHGRLRLLGLHLHRPVFPYHGCDAVQSLTFQVWQRNLGALTLEVSSGCGISVCDYAMTPRADGRTKPHQRVFNHYTLVPGHAQALLSDVVYHGIRFLLVHVVASNDHVEFGQPLGPHNGVNHLLKACARGGAADAHGYVRIVQALVHQLQHPRPRVGRLLHNLFVKVRLAVLQVVHEGILLCGSGGGGVTRTLPRERGPAVLVEVPFHLGLASPHGVLQHVVVGHRPLHLHAVNLQLALGEGAVVRQAVQLLRLHNHPVAVKQDGNLSILCV
mmetsp:Transcript_49573/g.94726  ORF Transcript_49573/g.94726 Transcript_49573/m.94726 type:complete len:277 (-) Transcript_49573:267-1097(-)